MDYIPSLRFVLRQFSVSWHTNTDRYLKRWFLRRRLDILDQLSRLEEWDENHY